MLKKISLLLLLVISLTSFGQNCLTEPIVTNFSTSNITNDSATINFETIIDPTFELQYWIHYTDRTGYSKI